MHAAPLPKASVKKFHDKKAGIYHNMNGISFTGADLNPTWKTNHNTNIIVNGNINAHTIPNSELVYFALKSFLAKSNITFRSSIKPLKKFQNPFIIFFSLLLLFHISYSRTNNIYLFFRQICIHRQC